MRPTAAYKRFYDVPTANEHDSLCQGPDAPPVGLRGFVHAERPHKKNPFHAERPRPRCFKMLLNSTDRFAGSPLHAASFRVSLPRSFQNKRLNLVVDSFHVASAPNGTANLSLYPYYVRIAELRSPMTIGNGGEILLTSGSSYHNTSPRDVGGLTVTDRTLFDRPITVEMWSPYFDVGAPGGVANNWSIQLSVYDDVEEED